MLVQKPELMAQFLRAAGEGPSDNGRTQGDIVTSHRRRFTIGQGPAPAPSPWRGRSPQHTMLYVLVAFLGLCLVAGGSNRANVPQLLVLRPLTVITLFVMLVVPARRDFEVVRAPLVLLGLLAATIAVQLIPLPPFLWTRLPGHAPFTGAGIALGGIQPWRPISLTPDLTLNSLLALLVPATVLVGFAGLCPDQRTALVPLAIGAAATSAVLGILQFAGGGGVFLLYSVNWLGTPDGWFANRNHQAAFLVCGLALTAAWLRFPERSSAGARRRWWAAGPLALLLFSTVIASGSRSGTLLALVVLAHAAASLLRGSARRQLGARAARGTVAMRVAVVAVVPVVGGIMLFAGRAVALDRLFGFDAGQEERVQAYPTLFAMWRDFAWTGSGFGSFDPLFRMYEPDAMLKPTNFNHAHNDWLELGLTGGMPALVVLALFVGWAGLRMTRCWRVPHATATVLSARGAGIALLVLGAASMSDYPLRTPLMAALMALSCAWLAGSTAREPASEGVAAA